MFWWLILAQHFTFKTLCFVFSLSPLCSVCTQQMVKVCIDMVKMRQCEKGNMLACFRMLVSSHTSCSTGSRTPSNWQLMAGMLLEMENGA